MAAPTWADIDMVRLLIGDPAGASEQLSDDQIALLLESSGLNRYAAAAAAADAIAALYAGRVDTRVGILSTSDSQLSRQYRELAGSLRAEAGRQLSATATPWAGGVRGADKQTVQGDPALVRPAFMRETLPYAGNEERC